MIEIPEGWTAFEAQSNFEMGSLTCEIDQLNEKLEAALERQAIIREACKHRHVFFCGQEMRCNVCGARIEK